MTRPLIVTADDFGLTDGVCAAIFDGHEAGALTATSVLAVGPAFARNATRLAETPELEAGLHLAFVGEDPPLLSAGEIPSLVDRKGRLPLTWRRFVARAAAGRVDPDDLRREARAQLDLVRGAGIAVRHLNCHQHLQLWPTAAPVIIELAVDEGVPVVRAAGGDRASGRSALVALPARHMQRRLTKAGRSSPDLVVGLAGAGHMTGGRLRAALDHVARRRPLGTAELVLHPGRPEDPDLDRYRWGYSWSGELDVLIDGSLLDLAARREIALVAPSTLGAR